MSFYSALNTQSPRAHNKNVLGNKISAVTRTELALNDYSTYSYVELLNRDSLGDGGGGLFRVDTADGSTPADNGVVYIDSVGNRLKRIVKSAVNSRWFGLVGDGSTDDYAGLQAALDYAGSKKSTLILAELGGGTEYISSATLVIHPESKLMGESRNVALKLGDAVNDHLIVNYAHSLGVYDGDGISTTQDLYCAIENLTIDGNRQAQTVGGQYSGIWFNNVRYGLIKNCVIKDSIKHNVELWGCNYTNVINNIIVTSGVTNLMLYKKNNYCLVTNNKAISAGQDAGIGTGIIVDNSCAENIVSNNTCVSNAWDGINVEEGASGNIVNGNVIESSGRYGISTTDGQSGLETKNNRFVNNYISNCGSHGIYASGVKKSSITNNTVVDAGASGIYLQKNGTSGNECDGCNVRDNLVQESTNYGIYAENAARVTISGNKVEECDNDGILGNAITFSSIADNQVYYSDRQTSASNYAQIKLTGVSANNEINGNVCYNPNGSSGANFGVWIASASVTSTNITKNKVLNSRVANIANNDTSATIKSNAGYLEAETVYDPPSVAAGSVATTVVAVSGAAFGDHVLVSFTNSLNGMELSGYVSSANNVTVVVSNNTATPQDLGSGTLHVIVEKN